MKLPDFPGPGPVPAVDTRELQGAYYHLGEERGQLGHAIQYAGGALRELGMEVAVVSSQVQHMDAINAVADADAKAKQKVANKTLWSKEELVKEFGSEGNIPQSIKDSVGGSLDELTPSDDPNVEATPTGKTTIPGFAVNSAVYEKDMRAAVDAAAQGITLPGWRNEFLRTMHHQITQEVAAHTLAAKHEMYQYLGAKAFITATHLADNGQVDAALMTLQMTQGIPQAEVEKWKESILKDAGIRAVRDPLFSDDREYIKSTIAGLRSQENEFTVTDKNGITEKVNVSALPLIMRGRQATNLETHLRQLDHADDLAAKKAQEERDDSARTTFNTALFSDNPSAIRSAYFKFGQVMQTLSPKTQDHIMQLYKSYFDGLDKRIKKEVDPGINQLSGIIRFATDDYQSGTGDGSYEWNGQKFNIRDGESLVNNLQAMGADPAKVIAPLHKLTSSVVRGKAVPEATNNSILKQNMVEAGFQHPMQYGDMMQAAQEAAAAQDKYNVANGGRAMNAEQLDKFYYNWLNYQKRETKPGDIFGKYWTTNTNTAIKDLPRGQQVALVRARATVSQMFPPTPEGTVDFYQKANPISEELTKLWPETASYQAGRPLDPNSKWEYSAKILSESRELDALLDAQGKPVTDRNRVLLWLSKNGKGLPRFPEQSKARKELLP